MCEGSSERRSSPLSGADPPHPGWGEQGWFWCVYLGAAQPCFCSLRTLFALQSVWCHQHPADDGQTGEIQLVLKRDPVVAGAKLARPLA